MEGNAGIVDAEVAHSAQAASADQHSVGLVGTGGWGRLARAIAGDIR